MTAGGEAARPDDLGFLRRSLTLFERLVDEAPVGLALFDDRGRYLHINEALAAIHGIPAEEHLGRTVHEVLGGMDPAVPAAIEEVIRTGQPVTDAAVTGRTPAAPDEDRHWVVSYYPVRTGRDDPLVVGVVVVDVTERRRADEERAGLLIREQLARSGAERLAARLALLQAVTAALTGAAGTAAVTDVAFSAVRDSFGAETATLWMVQEPQAVLSLVATSDGRPESVHHPLVALDAALPVAEAVRRREPVFIESWRDLISRWPALAAEHRMVESVALLPLVAGDRCLGCLGLRFVEARQFGVDDRRFLTALAAQCASSLERAVLYDQVHLALSALGRLQQVAARLVSVDRLDQLVPVVVDEAREALGAVAGYLTLLDDTGKVMQLVGTSGYLPDQVAAIQSIPLSTGTAIGAAVMEKRTVWVSGADDFRKQWPDREPLVDWAFNVMPLITDDEVLGAMGYSWPQDRVIVARDHVELSALAGQCSQAVVRIRLHAAERRARRRVEFLADASRQLSSLRYEEVLERALRLTVPELADTCAVHVVVDTTLRLAGAVASDSKTEAAMLAVAEPVPASVHHALALDGARLAVELGATDLTAALGDGNPEDVARLVEGFGVHSAIAVPLRGRRAPLGVLSMTARRPRRFDADDLAVAEELGRRVGVALENALLFAAEAEVATTLQRSLLPPALPSAPGLHLAARYDPVGTGSQVGGDFYDVFADPGGGPGWVLMVGDVVGTGPHAAATTALVRHTARAVSGFVRDPEDVVAAVNRTLSDDEWGGGERFCTMALGRLTPAGDAWWLELVSAGHPPVLVVRAGGERVEEVAARGVLLGQFPDVAWEPVRIRVAPGDAVVLYTDGVTEARRPGGGGSDLFGEDRLAAVITDVARAGGSADDLADAVERAALAFSGEAADDVAILVVQIGSIQPVDGATVGRGLRLAFAPDPSSVRDARLAVTDALGAWGSGGAVVERAALATTELATNAVLHAATTFEVSVSWDGVTAEVAVVDGSPTLPGSVAAGETDVTGRGLALVEAVSDAWGLELTGPGKRVWARLRSGPARDTSPGPRLVAPPAGGVMVRLVGVPLDRLGALERHDDAVLRELELLAIGAARGGGAPTSVPAALVDLAHQARGASAVVREVLRQAAGGEPFAVGEGAVAAFGRYLDLAEAADRYCGGALFLVEEAAPDLLGLRRWVLGEVASQVAGEPAHTWPG